MTTGMIKTRKTENGNTPSSSFTGLVDKLFQDNLSRFFNEEPWSSNSNIPINVKETDKTYELDLVAPSLKKENFDINVNGDMLTVSFERREENKEEKENWLRQEYRMESFSRIFHLDETIDANKINGTYNDGILHLTIPKKEHAQKLSKKIEIM